MSIQSATQTLTHLLAQASVHYLRLTLEELPVGLIEITENGVIEWIDDWTAEKIGIKIDQLRGTSITLLLVDTATEFLQSVRKREYGNLFQVSLLSGTGQRLLADIVLTQSLQSHKFVCSVIFTTNGSGA